jgi:phosphate starvation-inducible PhoH-like protein
LKDVDGIGIIRLNQSDVIRHPLVKKIIDAFEKAEAAEQKLKDEKEKE